MGFALSVLSAGMFEDILRELAMLIMVNSSGSRTICKTDCSLSMDLRLRHHGGALRYVGERHGCSPVRS